MEKSVEKKYSLLANFERFTISFQLNGKHMLWITLGSYLCYRTFDWYRKERAMRISLFQKYYPEINAKYKDAHRRATGELVHFKGHPDDGDWLYSKLIPEKDYSAYRRLKAIKLRNRREFNQLLPLYFTAGLVFPGFASGLALFFMLADDMENNLMLRASDDFDKNLVDDSWFYNSFLNSKNIKSFVFISLMGASYASAFKLWKWL